MSGFCEYCKHGRTVMHAGRRCCNGCGHVWPVIENGVVVKPGIRGNWWIIHPEVVT